MKSVVNPSLTYRRAMGVDLDLLADWNYQLIHDEGHRNALTVNELRDRMREWLAGEYRGILFHFGSEPVAYAVYKETQVGIYLRHFFVHREHRRKGFGKAAMAILIQKVWPRKRLVVEVLWRNEVAVNFWKAIGYEEYSLCLEIPAQD